MMQTTMPPPIRKPYQLKPPDADKIVARAALKYPLNKLQPSFSFRLNLLYIGFEILSTAFRFRAGLEALEFWRIRTRIGGNFGLRFYVAASRLENLRRSGRERNRTLFRNSAILRRSYSRQRGFGGEFSRGFGSGLSLGFNRKFGDHRR